MLKIGRIVRVNQHTAWIDHPRFNVLAKMTHKHNPGDIVIYWMEKQKYTNNMRFAPLSINFHYTLCIAMSMIVWIGSVNLFSEL